MKKILFVSDNRYLGGGEIALLNLINALRKLNHGAILIISDEGPFFHEAVNQSIDVRIIDMSYVGKKAIKYPFRFLNTIFKIGNIIKKEEISCIFANTLNVGINASLAGKVFGIKCIWYCWGHYFPKNRFWQRMYRILFHKIVFCSHYVKEKMHINTFIQDDLPVVYPGIDVHFWGGDNTYFESLFRKENGIPENYRIFSIIARVDPWKNHAMFLNVANEIAKKYPNSFFVIAGGDNEDDGGDSRLKSELEKKIENLPALREKIIFTGFVRDIKKVIKASSIIFSCSGKGGTPESFSISIMEIMASGRPLVATSTGGTPEIVVNGFNGFLVDLDDYKDMVKKALYLINSRSEYDSIVNNARRCVAEKYAVERFAKDIAYNIAMFSKKR